MRTASTSSTIASVTTAGTSIATGTSAAMTTAATMRCGQAVHVAPPERDVREEVEDEPPEHRDGDLDLQRVVDVLERLLEAERQQHDAGDHRQVQEGEGVPRDLVALAAGRGVLQPPRSDERDDVEVQPPQRRRDAHAETAATTPPASSPASAPIPIATIDSPSAMMTISPWRSAKCSGSSFQPSAPKSAGPPMSSRSARSQSATLQRAVGERRGRDDARPRARC